MLKNVMWGCVLIPASGCTTQNCISEDCLALHWEKQNKERKYSNYTIIFAFQHGSPDSRISYLIIIIWKVLKC
jgi:hypothetical protein